MGKSPRNYGQPISVIRDGILVDFESPLDSYGSFYRPEKFQDKAITARVVGVGLGRLVNGERMGPGFRVGDRVIVAKFQGQSFTDDRSRTLSVVPEKAVLATVEAVDED